MGGERDRLSGRGLHPFRSAVFKIRGNQFLLLGVLLVMLSIVLLQILFQTGSGDTSEALWDRGRAARAAPHGEVPDAPSVAERIVSGTTSSLVSPISVDAFPAVALKVPVEDLPRTMALRGSVVEAETGEGVPEATVYFIGECEGYSSQTLTNAVGAFIFPIIPLPVGQSVIYAQKGERVSSSRMLRQSDQEVNLTLTAGGAVGGVVLLKPDDRVLAGVDVVLRPRYMSGFRIKTVSNDQGRFAFEIVPAGSYVIEGFADAFYEPPNRGMLLEKEEFVVVPGSAIEQTIQMRRMAEVTGRVLEYDGLACGDAAVTMRATWGLPGNQENRTVAVGLDGRFSIHTGRVLQNETLRVQSKRGGDLSVSVKDLREGETRDIGDITLPGGVHVTGRVRDEQGRGIVNIGIMAIGRDKNGKSLEDGTFDLGILSLSEDGSPLRFRFTPQKFGSGSDFQALISFPPVQPAGVLPSSEITYCMAEVSREGEPGGEIYLEVILETAEMASFAGKVINSEGEAVSGARVVLFLGNAGPKSWLQYVDPMSMMISSYAPNRSERVLGRATSGEGGEWNISFVWQDRLMPNYWEPAAEEEIFCFSLGVSDMAGANQLVSDLEMRPPDLKRDLEVVLGKSQNAAKIAGTVVDQDGKSIAGITLSLWNAPGSPQATSDAEGRFEIAFSEKHPVWESVMSQATIRLKSDGWALVSPNERDRGMMSYERLPDGEWPQDIAVVVGHPGKVSGRVLWEDGTPVIGYVIRVGSRSLSVNSPAGLFALDNLSPGEITLVVTENKGITQSKEVSVASGETTEAEVRLPKGERWLDGLCLKADGGPFPGLSVRISGMHFDGQVNSDFSGKFRCDLPAGDYDLEYSFQGNQDRESSKVHIPEDKDHVAVVLQEKSSGKLIVEVVGLDENPLEGIRLRYDMKYFSTDAQGLCEIDVGSRSGRIRLSVEAPDYTGVEMMQYSIPRSEEASVRYRICLGEGFRISGRVLCGGQPVGNIHLTLSKGGEYSFGSIHTKGDGEFAFGNLQKGERVTIRGTSYHSNASVSREVVVDNDITGFDIQMPTGSIRGRLLDAKGRLLKRYAAQLRCEKSLVSEKPVRETGKIFEEGLMEFIHVEDGEYYVDLLDERQVVATSRKIVIRGGETVEGVDLRLGQ